MARAAQDPGRRHAERTAALPELQGQGFYELLDKVYRTGEAHSGRAAPASLIPAVGAEPEERILDFVYQPMRGAVCRFKQDRGLDITFGGVPSGVTDNDGFLGRVLADNGVVGARYFYFDHVSKSDTPQKPEFRFNGRFDLLSLNLQTAVDRLFSAGDAHEC
jgi:hypothetical protein